MLGDGGIASNGTQISVTLNNVADREYINFVSRLMRELFKSKPSLYICKDSKASRILFSSVDLVEYLGVLGLKRGNKIKQQIDIPNWIKINKLYSISCLRGLIDTDGCIFNHSYIVNGKRYSYKKLAFASYSQPMRKSVYNILSCLGIKPRLFSFRDVRIDGMEDMGKYFKIVGTHNPKHLKRYIK